MKRRTISGLAACALGAVMLLPGAQAADTPVQEAIERGITWLVAQQDMGSGSWGGHELVAHTGFAVVKLEERAFELGYASPFDDAYPYKQNVIAGLDYLFSQAGTYDGGVTICFAQGGHETYSTGIAMMAIAASRAPNRVVNVAGSIVNGWTYKAVLQACVGFFAWSQNPDGGWRYWVGNQPSDNSNTGYAVLGLRYAEAPQFGFSCVIAPTIRLGLNNWITTIQDPVNDDPDDGGSWYDPGWPWVNQLKTGNLLFEMSFLGDTVGVQRVQDALDYIERHWNDNNMDPGWRPHEEQAMYCLMKGLASVDVDTLTVEGNPVDWYTEFAQALVDAQQPDGYWAGHNWGDDLLYTAWALLVLEKVAPPPPIEVTLTLPACACDQAGYVVKVTYTVERFLVDGTLNLFDDGVLVDTLTLTDFTGTTDHLFTVASDTPGEHAWKAELDVVPTGGGTPAHADDEGKVTVCETPQVGDIPDQVTPFPTFDLDSYLTYGGALPVTWTASGVPADWTVAIDPDNVVTVTAPAGATDPATITFTASVTCCDEVVCGDSDPAVFTPNQPPDCSDAYPSIARLWPPNNKFVAVQVLGVTDPDGDAVTITITAIRQDEPVDTYGDGSFAPDGSGVGSSTAQLRAERSGTKKVPGNGRAYYLYFTADDGRGMSCSGAVLVGVPHDVKDAVIADGPNYDSTIIP